MLVGALPMSVLAAEVKESADDPIPVVSVASLYSYSSNQYAAEFRALPDKDGVFYLDIALDKAPKDDEVITVYYRTVDDSAVSKWGDYESVGVYEESFVTLTKSNNYTQRVTVRSTVIDYGFAARDDGNQKVEDKLVTRRFIFELTRVEGNAKLHTPSSSNFVNKSKLYCYLRANNYNDQNMFAAPNTSAWESNMRSSYIAEMQALLDYYEETDPNFGWQSRELFWDQVNEKWDTGTANIKYTSLYHSTNAATAINTPHIKYKGQHSDTINLKFADEWRNYVASGVTDLGISINGTIERDFWDSSGNATFHLYYNYRGEKKIALSLYLQGEFDDSNFFGWEHAFEYAVEGLESNNRKDHMDENFIGFTLYDNDGNTVYEVKAKSRSDADEDDLCEDLKRAIKDKYATEMMAENNEQTKYNDNFTAYYLKLPSNFALADSYSYEFISDSAHEKEIRWLENVKLSFTLTAHEEPMIAKDSSGKQMVTTNLETMREGDLLRMSIRFDRPVYVYNLGRNFYITADIYSDKGACLAKGVKLAIKQLEGATQQGSYYYYAWDTLVFECELPETLRDCKIASLRNIKIPDNAGSIQSFFTGYKILNKTINNVYVEKDLRTPVATLGNEISDNWSRSKSVDVYVSVKGGAGARFTDFVTVYYQWSNSAQAPLTYNSSITFHTDRDGEMLKTIIGTGNGEVYLHLKALSGYGKSSTVTYGPFKFDNLPPELSPTDNATGTLKAQTITVPLPNDRNGIGVRDASLYYVNKNGEGVLLKKFAADEFTGEPKSLSYTISHMAVGVGVGVNEELILERRKVDFYWILSDKIGNTSEKTAEFSLIFDTNDYLESEITEVGPYDISTNIGDAQFKNATTSVNDFSFIYNYDFNSDKIFKTHPETDKAVYYAFFFELNETLFGENDNGIYGANVHYKGELLDSSAYTVIKASDGVRAVLFHSEMQSGRYDIQLKRTEGESIRLSNTYSVYATNGEQDDTYIKEKVESGTLLTNSVYQLSTEYPYFYYKDINGTTQTVYYNGTKQPATFSSLAKAKEYVYYVELGDIYLFELTEATASALSSGTTGYLMAKGETMVPRKGQYWIRYKSSSWTPTSGDSSWVYYYYGSSGELSEGALSPNLQTAINTVANRIIGYGKPVMLTDSSLFLDTAMGDKMLDQYGMPYLFPGQIHDADELSYQTMCGNVWSEQIAFAADKNIYKSSIYVGEQGSAAYNEYPIVGNFALPEETLFQYMTYAQYKSYEANGMINPAWISLDSESAKSFINVFASGVYYIREISIDGVSVYAIYVDKEAPKVTFYNTDDNGNFREIPVDATEILDIRTKDLYIGSFAASEYDRLSYVAVYKASNFALVGVYSASDVDDAPIRLDDGNYYLIVADRSGNHYTITAKVSSSDLECQIKESPDRYIKLTCNRKSEQILIYEVYLNNELVSSTYAAEQNFDKAGVYSIYIQDIYGNVFTCEHTFTRKYPTVTWKYLGTDGKYHTYDAKNENNDGFAMMWIVDNQYRISTSVKTRFSFSESYEFEFVGAEPEYNKSVGSETVVTIDAGQSFTLKVYYKNHKDCYVIYSGAVDITPPSINVSADMDMLRNGEYELFDEWLKNGIAMNDIYYVLTEIARRNITNGAIINSDVINISASDANQLSLLEVYLNGELINKQNTSTGFSGITVSKSGEYRIVAKDTIGNVAEFTFTNGMSDGIDYFVDGKAQEPELHGYLNFKTVDGKHVYTNVDYGKSEFKLDVKQNADIFMSLGVSAGSTKIYGFRISDGCIYPLTYTVGLDKNGNKEIVLAVADAILDSSAKDFSVNDEYVIAKNGTQEIYASISADKIVTIKVYASSDVSKCVSVSARIEFDDGNMMFVSSEISKRASSVTFKELGMQSATDIRANNGFTVDEKTFESERISQIRLYYSKLNDLDSKNLDEKTNIYVPDKQYWEEGFYLLIVSNLYGNEKVYRIAISRTYGITSSVTFSDGYKAYYSKDYSGTLYSNDEITLDILDNDVTYTVTLNGAEYKGYYKKENGAITYLVFSDDGEYTVKLTDSYGNTTERLLVIDKTSYKVADELLVGYNEKALKRDDGYTNQKLSIDKAVFDREGIYYLAIQFGEKLTVLFDAFAEELVEPDTQAFVDIIGIDGDGVYTVICRNRYGAVVETVIHYRATPTLKLERTIRSKSAPEEYDLMQALALGFWSNNTLTFSTDAKHYVFTVDGSVTDCPRTLVFENAGDFGSFEYEITYIDEYGFEYRFKAHLVRKSVALDVPSSISGIEIGGILNTKNDISVTFDESAYATYTVNNGEELAYNPGDVLKRDGTYRFTVVDYAGNVSKLTVKKDTAVEFEFIESTTGSAIQNGGVTNSSKVTFDTLNKDTSYIEKVFKDGVLQKNPDTSKFTEDGKWEFVLRDELGNRAYFSFYIITRSQNGFAYTTPYEYTITELWFDSGDGVKISYMGFANHSDSTSSFDFAENGKYYVVMTSEVTGNSSSFTFTVNTLAPDVSLVGCNPGDTTINDVTIAGCKVGDRIKIYRATDSGEELVQQTEVTTMSTRIPTVTEGGKYRIVVESEAGVETELTFVRKHVMNTSGSIFIMILIGVSVIGLFTGLVYRNKSKTDD